MESLFIPYEKGNKIIKKEHKKSKCIYFFFVLKNIQFSSMDHA